MRPSVSHWPAASSALPDTAGRSPSLPDVPDTTRELWERQDQPVGDRLRLFAAVAGAMDVATVLYPGSYVDLAPSFIWPSVTYVDVDRRASRFFSDHEGVGELLTERGVDPGVHAFRFLHTDYQERLALEDRSFDLLISLYAGFVSEHCTRYLRKGGFLLVNSSHGDAAMASIDDRYRLSAVATSRAGDYRVRTSGLSEYLVPKREIEVTREYLHGTGRGIAYTKSPFAYLFERID